MGEVFQPSARGARATLPIMLLRPNFIVGKASEVTPRFLREQGIRAVMVDLDDTLIASNGVAGGKTSLDPAFTSWLDTLKAAHLPILILSNGSRKRVAQWSKDLGVLGLSLVGKPFTFAFRRGLRRLGSKASETAMIGDQLFTDVLGANLVGMTSILVTPLSPGNLLHTRLLRHLETRILRGDDRGGSIDRR